MCRQVVCFDSSCAGNSVSSIILRLAIILLQITFEEYNEAKRIILHHVLDVAISTLAYIALGSRLAFGKDIGHVVGAVWSPVYGFNSKKSVMGWVAVMVAGGILTLVMNGVSLCCKILITVVFASIVQPLLLHWICTEEGWLRDYQDTGAALIHASGGMAAFLTALSVRRSLQIHRPCWSWKSRTLILAGYILFIGGLVGSAAVPSLAVLLYYLIAGSSGAVAIPLLQLLLDNSNVQGWKMISWCQGAVPGVVTYAAAQHPENYFIALAYGSFGAALSYTLAWWFRWSPRDPLNLSCIHLLLGVMGNVLSSTYMHQPDALSIFWWKLLGTLFILGLPTIVWLLVFCVLLRRNRAVDAEDSNDEHQEVSQNMVCCSYFRQHRQSEEESAGDAATSEGNAVETSEFCMLSRRNRAVEAEDSDDEHQEVSQNMVCCSYFRQHWQSEEESAGDAATSEGNAVETSV